MYEKAHKSTVRVRQPLGYRHGSISICIQVKSYSNIGLGMILYPVG